MLRICSSSLLSARILIFILFATIALQVNGQIPEDNDEAEPKAVARQQGGKRKAKDDRVILRDLITEIPISPIRVPMGFPQKAAAVLDEVDYNTYEVKRTSVCYIAYEDVSELGNILGRCRTYTVTEQQWTAFLQDKKFTYGIADPNFRVNFELVERYFERYADDPRAEETLIMWPADFYSMLKFNLKFQRLVSNRRINFSTSVVVNPRFLDCEPDIRGYDFNCRYSFPRDSPKAVEGGEEVIWR